MNSHDVGRIKQEPKIDIMITLIICVLTLISRIPFFSRYIKWQAINFAFAFEKYDIFMQQPHPPGYILYVTLGKFINLFWHDARMTMLFLSVFFSIFTAVLVYFLAKDIFSWKIGIASSLLLLFNPIFWFYGVNADVYICEAFFSTLIAYLSYQVLKGREKYLYASAVVLGLSGGFRQDLVIFMFPLWVFCIFSSKIEYWKLLKSFVLLFLSVFIWLFPTIELSGGYLSYYSFTKEFLTHYFQYTSMLFGATLYGQLHNFLKLFLSSIMGMSILGVLISLLLVIHYRRSIFKVDHLKNRTFIFAILWILPAFSFYSVVHFANPGYSLVYLPMITVIIAYLFFLFSSVINKSLPKISICNLFITLILITTLIHCAYFVHADRMQDCLLNSLHCVGTDKFDDSIDSLDTIMYTNYYSIQYFDSKSENDVATILKISNFSPKNTLVIVKYDYVHFPEFAKVLAYYLPDYNFIFISREDRCYAYQNIQHLPSASEIIIEPGTEAIIWITDDTNFIRDLNSQMGMNNVIMAKNNSIYDSSIYYSDVKNLHMNFKINGTHFITGDGL